MSEPPISLGMTGEPHAGTLEIELSAADLLPQHTTEQQAPSSGPPLRFNIKRRVTRVTGPLAVMFAFVALRSFAQYAELIAIPPSAVARPPAAPQQLVAEKPPQLSVSSPMRMANPFDTAEVFEFPPGTSKAEAREWIADLLMQRARDRRPQWGAVKRKARQPLSADTSAS